MTEVKEPQQRQCRGCGTDLLFIRTTEGKLMPLDLRAPTYVIETDLIGQKVAVRAHGSFVSHFSTCPKAGEFSKGKKQ